MWPVAVLMTCSSVTIPFLLWQPVSWSCSGFSAGSCGHLLADRVDQRQLFLDVAIVVVERLGVEVLVGREE